MHDFMLAKEIMAKLTEIALSKKIKKAKKVYLEIGQISMAHDGQAEHTEDISLENLKFGLESVAKGTAFAHADFFIQKAKGNSWKIVDIEVI